MSGPNLSQQVIVITGASGGIGEHMARECINRGATVILMARSAERLSDLKDELEGIGHGSVAYEQLDVSRIHDVEAVFSRILSRYGHIDVLINNAGFGVFDYAADMKIQDVQVMLDVNVVGLMACTKAVIPAMNQAGKGHIINVASIAGKMATPKSTAYSASKHAVLGFSNGLRMELEGTGVHVTTVNPGPVRTNFFNIADPDGGYFKNVERFMLEPDSVAKKVVSVIGTPKREINLPVSMSVGAYLYQLMPGVVERMATRLFRFK